MAYNPFDDVIEQDPAYMSNGGGLQVDVLSDAGFQDFFKIGRDYLQSQGKDPFGGTYSIKDIERIGRDISNAQPGQANVMAEQPAQEPRTTIPVPQFISEGEQIRDKQQKLQQIEDIVPGAFYQSMQPVYEQRQQEDFSQQKKMIGAAGEYTYDFIVPEEAAARAKEKREKNKQILEELGFRAGNMNREQRAEAIARGFTPLTAGEALAEIPDFLFGDQLKAFRKLRKGEPLEAGEGYALLTVPLDILDFAGIGLLGGVAAKPTYKLIQRLKKKYFDEAGVPDIKSILDNETYAFDPDVQEAKRIFGGSPVPLIQDAAAGPPGMPGIPRIALDEADRPGGSSTYQKLTEEGKYNPTSAFGEKMQKDIEKKNKKFQLLEEYYTNNPADKTESAIKVRQNLKNLLPEGETLIKDVDIQQYARDNPNTALGKAVKPPKVPRAEQLTKDKFDLLQQEFNETGEKINLLQASELVNIPYNTFRRLSMENEELAKLVAPKPIVGRADTLFHSYFPTKGKNSLLEKQAQYTIIRDMYRANGLGNNTKEFEAFMKELGFVPNKLKTIVDGKVEYKINPDYNLDDMTERRQRFFDEVIKPTFFKERGSFEEYLNKLRHRNALTNYSIKKFIDTVKNNPAFQEQFVKEYRKKYKDSDILDDVEAMAYDFAAKNFNAQMAHVMPIDLIKAKTPKGEGTFKLAPNLEGMMFQSPFINVNYAAHNIGTQRKFENIIRKSISQIKNGKNVDQNLNKLIDVNNAMTERGLQTYLRFTDKQMPEKAFKLLQAKLGNKVQVEPEVAGVKSIFLGDRGFSLEENIKFFDDRMQNYIDNPQDFKISNKLPKTDPDKVDEMFIKGSAPYIGEGKPTNFKKGGPVKMAIGGDPLTNLNKQQFSPDPAFEGQDFFEEAVDSGNLQAVNLLNLFKVFKKPKVMATPSNVKQVEQARDPMPQGVPGSQQIQPLPAGKPDFFFKSFLLDQLNLPNAPKASTPQGWREFLIKGKKVPEAEMLDTGILQYLEDTEKFYPNKKITKQELEDLYDTSPLGNLEVRVKETLTPETQFGDGDFIADQGRPKHKGAGNANIDNQADDYFEVVVNVPSLPGQERAFVNSSHFNEPNVLGFTRVGTYKNSKNETVAVIQEMQTDMLTEVRKEQERLFAMINALKRERAKLENLANTSANPDYYKNELRLFNQKYPQSRLDALETDNLIKPFPNIVAKDLIPERTANLNSIQEQINKLMMANVEQYNDPAYKTLVFDLAQQQKKIFEDLSSMNRSANYEESLRDFKVPSTTDRNELNRIANTDEYLPSSYNLRQVESFPPIPFNKQADYVDLLIKSTIKAAKGKGIDKVAIMPANVGANPRWGKSGDEAKKKFENLYDKVGVQQLKNIAKKYGGKLEIEKIIDPSKQTRGLTFLNKNPEGQFQILKQTEPRSVVSDADRDKFLDEEITRIVSGNTEPGDIVLTREIAPGQMMDYYLVEGRGDATDVGYRMIPLKEGESADDAMIKIVEYNPSEVDMYTISFDSSQLEEPMYLFKKKSGGSIDKDSLVSITDIYGEYGR